MKILKSIMLEIGRKKAAFELCNILSNVFRPVFSKNGCELYGTLLGNFSMSPRLGDLPPGRMLKSLYAFLSSWQSSLHGGKLISN